MMNLERAFSIGDLRELTKRRLPRILFEAIESGVEDERGLSRNEEAFQGHRLLPRYLLDVSKRDQSVRLFDSILSSPFGISPTGIAGVFRRDAELMLAQGAAEANIPFVISGASMASIESVARFAPQRTWYQVYPARDPAITESQVKRAHDAGCAALVLTVDTPVLPKRERDMRNGMGLPFRPPLPLLLEALTHPVWLFEYLRHGGMPMMQSWAPYAPAGASAHAVAGFFREQSPTAQTWRDLERFRRNWPRRLIVKGLMHPDDVFRAVEMGVDGVVISNHGGKALDRAPAPLEALPAIKSIVGDRVPIMLDSGVRRGSDVVVARCLGADLVFVGRATLYGVVAGATAGVRRAINILRSEIDTTLALIGCPVFAQLGSQFLMDRYQPTPAGDRKAAE
jgi:isopentenyl diphosphate isomerase/L-lactate dehydrogenase-like FMN-dependent dehydrogenase